MINHKLRHLPLAAAALVACAGAHAGYQSPDGNFSLSGFGTLGLTKSTSGALGSAGMDFVYPGQGGGAGNSWSANPDSKIAVQGTYKFTPTLSGTAQVMTKYDAFSQYDPTINWAFAKWQIAPSVGLRVGRMGGPFFMISDFRDVGFANTTVRPALDVYGQVPVSQFEGFDVSYQTSVGDASLNATLFHGQAPADYASAHRKSEDPLRVALGAPNVATSLVPSRFDLKKMTGVNLTAEMDNGLTLRFGHTVGKIDLWSPSVDALLAATASNATARANVNNTVVVSGNDISFTGLGLVYDQGSWVFSGEFTKKRGNSFIADTTGWYGNIGYRWNSFTPYVGLSRLSVDSANKTNPYSALLGINSVAAADVAAGGTGAGTADATLRASVISGAILGRGIQSLMNTQKQNQHTLTIGTRWDIRPNIALKAQWDSVSKPAGSYGQFFTQDPGQAATQAFLNTKQRINLMSLSMDVVF